MVRNRRSQDLLGRSRSTAPHILVALCVAAAITGSTWPIHGDP